MCLSIRLNYSFLHRYICTKLKYYRRIRYESFFERRQRSLLLFCFVFNRIYVGSEEYRKIVIIHFFPYE